MINLGFEKFESRAARLPIFYLAIIYKFFFLKVQDHFQGWSLAYKYQTKVEMRKQPLISFMG
jgi:hypothetical protein